MSSSLISRNDDLSALVKAGYRIKIRGAYLIVQGIPYIAECGEIKKADIVTNLGFSVEGEITGPPSDHTVWWTGRIPHKADGESMETYLCCGKWEDGYKIGEGITVYMQWSRKPREGGITRGYKNYQEKIETYVSEVAGQAESKQPGILMTARSGGDPEIESNTRFMYLNTSIYRDGTKGAEENIEEEIVAIIGVGGSGSYLVDILAKTNIKELHLYDDDVMRQENAFRLAGAARIGELGSGKSKVEWHRERYSQVRKEGLYIHPVRIDDENMECLKTCTTVFIAVDKLKTRRKIQRACGEMGVLHISVGIGLEMEGEKNNEIGGMVKVETDYQVGEYKKQGDENPDNMGDDVYGSNIQTAELNMLGAALAITEWKARRGVYRNERDEEIDRAIYSVTTGKILMR